MKNIKETITTILLMTFLVTIGQEGKVKRAKENFEDYAFMDAIASYEDLFKDGYSDEDIFKKLGNANYVNAQYESAAVWYGKLVKLENTKIDADYFYRYAQSLKSLGDYKGSDYWMEKFKSKKSGDQRAKNFLENENYLDIIKKNSGRYTLKNLTINSATSDFAPSFYGDTLVFTTARDSGITSKNIHNWNNGSFLNLHRVEIMEDATLGNTQKFTKELNTKTHESSSVFTKDGKTLYFTRNNSKNGKFSRDGKGISRLKIFKSVFKNGKWKKAIELPFNGDDYSVAHPALSYDEKTLYFSSDMPGTLGASDIFMVTINEDGSYGTPKNLGKTINTEARESFPFVSKEVLYFSSDGHPGLGGLDVFATKLDVPGEVINLGAPINGRQDDFSYVINTEGKGYFASNREGGVGNDDIYSFTEDTPLLFECNTVVNGMVTDKDTGNFIAFAKVIAMSDDNIIAETQSDANGSFQLEIDCNKTNNYLVGNKDTYLSSSIEFNIEKGTLTDVNIALEKESMPRAIVDTDLIKHLKLEPIYFNLDESNIRPDAQQTLNKVVTYLNQYPDINIAIESHTDVKASKSYNQRLSNRRAKATVDYLTSQGIAVSRMQSNGFGESKLINDCAVWVKCSPEQNERNRRSEIRVVN